MRRPASTIDSFETITPVSFKRVVVLCAGPHRLSFINGSRAGGDARSLSAIR